MAELVIRGGHKVSGTHRVPGNKNAVLPMIAAALLTEEPVTLENVPEIKDVRSMLAAAESFGVRVSRDLKAGTVTLCAAHLKTARIEPELAAKIRTSFLFAGPLLARLGRAVLPPPGGEATAASTRISRASAPWGRKRFRERKPSRSGASSAAPESSSTRPR